MLYGSRKRLVRHYVEVEARHLRDCSILPLTIIWDDGRRFELTVVDRPRRQRCATHGYAIRYDVLVRSQRRTLWRDEQGWFFELPEDEGLRSMNDIAANGGILGCSGVLREWEAS